MGSSSSSSQSQETISFNDEGVLTASPAGGGVVLDIGNVRTFRAGKDAFQFSSEGVPADVLAAVTGDIVGGQQAQVQTLASLLATLGEQALAAQSGAHDLTADALGVYSVSSGDRRAEVLGVADAFASSLAVQSGDFVSTAEAANRATVDVAEAFTGLFSILSGDRAAEAATFADVSAQQSEAIRSAAVDQAEAFAGLFSVLSGDRAAEAGVLADVIGQQSAQGTAIAQAGSTQLGAVAGDALAAIGNLALGAIEVLTGSGDAAADRAAAAGQASVSAIVDIARSATGTESEAGRLVKTLALPAGLAFIGYLVLRR